MSDNVDLRAAIDGLGTDEPASLYTNLVPVYDFIYERHYDYDGLADFVTEHAAEEATSITVGACGTGHTLARLAERYDDAVGVDMNREMLDRAATRTDAGLVEADLRSYVAPEAVDVFTVLGNSLVHLLTDEAVETTLANVHESLASGGTFLCDFMRASTFESGRVFEDTFTDERFRVDRTVISVADGKAEPQRTELGDRVRMAFAYALTDEKRAETVRFGESMPGRTFDAEALRTAAVTVGFDTAELVEGVNDHDGALVARKA